MKRTATTLVLLAGLGGGGCATSDQQARAPQQQQQQQPAGGFGTVTRGKQVDNLQGAYGEPVMATRGQMPGGSGVKQAGGPNMVVGTTGVIRPVSGTGPASVTSREGCTNCTVPGVGGSAMSAAGNYG